jgi:hypothetical protein
VLCVFSSIKQCICFHLHALQGRLLRWIKPLTTSLVPATFADLTRGRAELLAENALLRQQLIILRRQIKRPVYRKTDRVLLVFLARMVRSWKQALLIIQPETLLRWHRELFRVFWKHTSKALRWLLGTSVRQVDSFEPELFIKHSMFSECRCPYVSFIEFIARRPFAPESTRFHPFEASRCWNRFRRSAVGLGLDHWRLEFKRPSFTLLAGLAAHWT